MKKQRKVPAVLGGRAVFSSPLPITTPTISASQSMLRAIGRVVNSRQLTNGNEVRKFEKAIERYLGVRHAIALGSCTSGLMLILRVLGLRGEVILPSFTFHATAHAIIWNGLKPVFVDCDPETYNINPREAEKAITPKTAAIMAVNIFGNSADIEALGKIARKHGLKLIFDSAHAFGTKYQGKNAGGFGTAESFSLSPTKLLTAGEGGIVTTNDDELAAKIKMGRNYGDPGSYDPEFSGLSSRMGELNAILGMFSLNTLEKNVKRRNRAANLYRKHLSNIPGLSFQKINEGDRSSYKDLSILVDRSVFGLSRDQIYTALLAENIIVKKYFYPPVHRIRAFRNCQNRHKLPVTEKISDNSLSLPLFSHIDDESIETVCQAIGDIYACRELIGQQNI